MGKIIRGSAHVEWLRNLTGEFRIGGKKEGSKVTGRENASS
jgi:hypothetical protein